MQKYLVIEHKDCTEKDLNRVCDIVMSMFNSNNDGIGFHNMETGQTRFYLNGKRSFIIAVWSALKNNGYEVTYGVE